MNLCPYKNMFGEPGKGAHAYRVMNLAIVDLLATLGAAMLTAWLMGQNVIGWWSITLFFLLVVISVVVHRMFCVNTTLTRLVFEELTRQAPLRHAPH